MRSFALREASVMSNISLLSSSGVKRIKKKKKPLVDK